MKRILSLALCVGMVSAASATPIINTDFTTAQGYAEGDIALNLAWDAMPNTGSPTLWVYPTGSGYADSTPYYSTTNYHDYEVGNFLYISPSNGVGNAVDDEISGSVDFKLSTGIATGTNIFLNPNSITPLAMGLSAAATNRIGGGAPILLLDVLQNTGDFRVRFSGGTDHAGVSNNRELFRLSAADIGWDPASTNVPDYDSQNLRLEWTFRKTRTPGYYSASATITNLDGTAFASSADTTFDTFAMKTNTYDAANTTFAIGRHSNNLKAGVVQSTIDVAIDALSVDETSGNAPVLEPATLSASGGNEVVDLSWSTVMDATNYEIFRSTDSNSIAIPANSIWTTNVTAYTDSGLVNDTLYYYVVRASSAGATAADSNIAIGEPQAAATGSVIDTHFKASETPAYVNGNLNTQDRWKTAVNDASSEAFQVTDAGVSGFADSEPYTNRFDTTLGNNVYYNRLMSNNVGDEWTGTMTFTVKSSPVDGQVIERTFEIFDETGTNSLGNITTNYTIAASHLSEIFKFGLTANSDSGLEFNDVDDVFVVVRSLVSGRLDFQFQSTSTLERRFATLYSTQSGWDPNWVQDEESGPSFESDPVTINWTIRKASYPANTYSMWGEAIANGVTNTTGLIYTHTLSTGAYASDFVYFGMGIDEEASRRKAVVTTNGLTVGDTFEDLPVTVAVDSLSLTKADEQAPSMLDPTISAESVDGTSIGVAWDALIEAESYALWYSDVDGGPYTLLGSNLVDRVFTNSPLVNARTYFHVVQAYYGVFGWGSLSAQAIARPLATVTVASWGPSPDTSAAGGRLDFGVNNNTTNNVYNRTGNGPGGALLYSGRGDYNTTAAPPVYGIIQADVTADPARHFAFTRMNQDALVADPDSYVVIRSKDSGQHASEHLYIELSDLGVAPVDAVATDHSMEVEFAAYKWSGELSGGGLHAAVRNGSQWYVSETSLNPGNTAPTLGGVTVSIPSVAAEDWVAFTPATSNSTSMVTVVGASFVPATLDNITAIGFFGDHGRSLGVKRWSLGKGQTASPMQRWTDSYNIYNEDAAGTNDYDGDGVVNLAEWGFVGNPVKPGIKGKSPNYLGLDGSGTNMVYVYPRRTDEPRPTYTVVAKEDLILSFDWVPVLPDPQVGVGLWKTNAPGNGIRAVTNLVPVDVNQKFINVQLSE